MAATSANRPSTPGDPGFVLVKPSSLGDIVHALPALHFLRRTHPGAPIRWIANTEWCPLLEHVEGIDEVIAFPRRELRGLRALPRFLSWARATRREAPEGETVIDLQGLLRSALIARTRRHPRVIIGPGNAREGAASLYGVRAEVPAGSHALDHCLAVMEAAGVPCPRAEIAFPFGEGDRPADAPEGGAFLLLHPYSRGRGKTLEPEALERLLELLAPRPVVLVGSRPDEFPAAKGDHILDLCGRTSLGELLWLSRQARAVLSVDSGPLHIAAAVNSRVLGIHTWSDPRRVGPYGDSAIVWKAGRICRPGSITDAEAAATVSPAGPDLEAIAERMLAW